MRAAVCYMKTTGDESALHLRSLCSTRKLPFFFPPPNNASVNSSSGHRPPPPWATAGHLLTLSVPGWGICNFMAARGPGISIPRGDPREFVTRVFELTWRSLSGRTRPLWKTGLFVTDLKNLWMFLKVFSQF